MTIRAPFIQDEVQWLFCAKALIKTKGFRAALEERVIVVCTYAVPHDHLIDNYLPLRETTGIPPLWPSKNLSPSTSEMHLLHLSWSHSHLSPVLVHTPHPHYVYPLMRKLAHLCKIHHNLQKVNTYFLLNIIKEIRNENRLHISSRVR